MKQFFKLAIVISSLVLGTLQAQADYYSCHKKIYETGWLKKYEYKGQTWGANTKKSGLLSSSVGVTVENMTSSVDPGVTTGELMSSVQYSSSWGECAAVDMEISKLFRDQYIEQNLVEIKKQVAVGGGYHIDSLAVISGCKGVNSAIFAGALQKSTEALYDAPNANAFRAELDRVIHRDRKLDTSCTIPQV